MKRFSALLISLVLILSLTVCLSAQSQVLGKTVIFEQVTSHAYDKSEKLADGIKITNWYHWITLNADGFADLYSALQTEGAELIIKYIGNVDPSVTFGHWGTVSGVGCTDVIVEGGYNYAYFDVEAVKSMFTKYAANSGNIDGNGNIKEPMTMAVDGKDDIIYGIYVVESVPSDPTVLTTAHIDMDTTYQTIDGFGASYTWYSDWMVGIDAEEQGYDYIFNEAEFNILRFRDQHGLAGDEKYAPIQGYPKYKAYYDAAIERGIEPIVLVTSWGQYDRTLPFVAYTAKAANGYSYYTLAKDKNGEYMYDELADFCVQSVQYFIDAGIPVHYFSISNEIELQERHLDEQGNARDTAGFFFGMEENDDHCAYWKAHIAVYEAFKEAFGDNAPLLLGAETMAADTYFLKGYLDPVIENCPESLEIVGHHLYGTTLTERNFQKLYDNFSDYRLWQTEWYCNDYFYLGKVILDELVNENLNAYLYWNGVWPADDGNCLLEITDWTWESWWVHEATITRRPAHYIMTHFSKFIKNGYQRVDVSEGLKSSVGAFKSPDGKTLVVVAANNTENADTLNIVLNEGEIIGSSVYQSLKSTGEYMKDIGEFADGMSIPAGSLTTIVLEIDNGIDNPSHGGTASYPLPGGDGSVLAGDVNADGVADKNDAIYLLYAVLFTADKYPLNQNCDFDGDSEINKNDAIYLLYHVLFGDGSDDANEADFTISQDLTKSTDLGLSVGNTVTTAYKKAGEANPISSNIFFADPTSVEYNGRVYVYGTNDTAEYDENGGVGDNDYGSIDSLVCYSSADMVNWQFEQVIPVGDIATWTGYSWAPSIVAREEADGLTHFYLYFANSAAGVGVLTATSPTGPWTDPLGKPLVDGNHPDLKENRVYWCFDPGVVIDDNGVGWIAFGGGDPTEGSESGLYTGNCRFAKLGDDMISFASDIISIDAPYHFEANELNYINGTYVLTYCSNWFDRTMTDSSLQAPISEKCTMCYMTSTDPLDPDSWVYKGEYIGNPTKYGYWFSNNHTHMQKFGNKYYLFYQSVSLLQNMNHTTGGGYRSIGVNEIDVDEENVTLSYARMSAKGVTQTKCFDPYAINQAECSNVSAGISYKESSKRVTLVNNGKGNYILLNSADFAEGANAFAATVKGKGIIEIRLDSLAGEVVGAIQFDTGNKFETVWNSLSKTVVGKHNYCLVFGGDFEFDCYQFAK